MSAFTRVHVNNLLILRTHTDQVIWGGLFVEYVSRFSHKPTVYPRVEIHSRIPLFILFPTISFLANTICFCISETFIPAHGYLVSNIIRGHTKNDVFVRDLCNLTAIRSQRNREYRVCVVHNSGVR